jgi:hypothetical protein
VIPESAANPAADAHTASTEKPSNVRSIMGLLDESANMVTRGVD